MNLTTAESPPKENPASGETSGIDEEQLTNNYANGGTVIRDLQAGGDLCLD